MELTEAFGDVNWLAVLVAAVAAFAVGIVWFSPPVFGGIWAREVSGYTGIPDADIAAAAEKPTALSRWFLGILAASAALGLVAELAGVDSFRDGVALGVACGLGFGATLSSWPSVFARLPWRWWILNVAAFVVMLAVMGAIIGSWR